MSGDVTALAVAGAVGLLLGLERERHKGTGPGREPAGIRTFALVGLLGAVLRLGGGDAVVATGALFVGALAVVTRMRSQQEDPGITTEVALFVAFALGVLAVRDPGLAAAAGVVTTSLLAMRNWLHHFVRDSLSARELHDGLIFLAAAVVALPLTPDRALGPAGVINPFAIWRLVVILMGVSGAAYVIVRLVGPRLGLPISGFVSGFVSAAATVAAMGARAREQPSALRAATAGAALASVPTVLVAGVLVASADQRTFDLVSPPLVAAGIVAVAWAALMALTASRESVPAVTQGRAFDLRSAALLACVMTAALAVSTLANQAFPRGGVIATATLGGLADAHAAAFAAAVLAGEGKVSAHDAGVAVLAALSSNTLTKVVLAGSSRQRRFAAGVSTGLVLMMSAAWAAWLVGAGR